MVLTKAQLLKHDFPVQGINARKLRDFRIFFCMLGFGGGFGLDFRGVFGGSEEFCILYGGRMIASREELGEAQKTH